VKPADWIVEQFVEIDVRWREACEEVRCAYELCRGGREHD
jgi:hypothetical protein